MLSERLANENSIPLSTQINGTTHRLMFCQGNGCPTVIMTSTGYIIVGVPLSVESEEIKSHHVNVNEGEQAIFLPKSVLNEAVAAALYQLATLLPTRREVDVAK